jgi:hypothetical protein
MVAGLNAEGVVMASDAYAVRVNSPLAVCSDESVTVTVNETGPAAGGVPLRKPAGVSESHAGSPLANHTCPPLPPDAVKFDEYAVPTVAGASVDRLLIVSTAFTGRMKGWLWVFFNASVTVTLNWIAAALDAVPVNTPLGLIAKPCGRPVADHT